MKFASNFWRKRSLAPAFHLVALAAAGFLQLGRPMPATAQTNHPAAAKIVAEAASMDTLDDKHRLAGGDSLSFRIVEDNGDPLPLLVGDSGELEVPYIGRFLVLNKTCRQAAREIKKELEKEFYYQASVIIAVNQLSRSLGKVYLVGAVRVPGPVDIPGDEIFTVGKAIMRAGGFGDFADKKRVKITRKSPGQPGAPSRVIVANVGAVLEKGRVDQDVALEPGDLIYIPNRLVSF